MCLTPGFNRTKRAGKKGSTRKIGKYISQRNEVKFVRACPTACFVIVTAFSSHPH